MANDLDIFFDLTDLLLCFPHNNNGVVTLMIMVIESFPKIVLFTKQMRERMQHGWSILEFFDTSLPLSGK